MNIEQTFLAKFLGSLELFLCFQALFQLGKSNGLIYKIYFTSFKNLSRTCNELTKLKLITDIYFKSIVDRVFKELKYLKIIFLFPYLHNCITKLMAL